MERDDKDEEDARGCFSQGVKIGRSSVLVIDLA